MVVQYICETCGVICERTPAGPYVHPEPWATIKGRRVCNNPTPLREATARERKDGALRPMRTDRWMLEEQLAALVVPEGQPVEVAVVGFYAPSPELTEHPRGWGYLASDGHYGFGATTTHVKFDGPGELAAECRGLIWAIRKLLPRWRVTITSDYPQITGMVDAWRHGNLAAAPPGADLGRRPSGRESKLVRAARAVHQHAYLVTAKLVEDYDDTPLGVGADKLSRIGWDWCAGKIDKEEAARRGLRAASKALNVPADLVPRQS